MKIVTMISPWQGALGMFPQYTNFVRPMRLIPRGGMQAADKSVHDAHVDFDNWDEMDELFSDSELQFSDDLDIEDEHHSIVIDRMNHCSYYHAKL